MALSVFDDKTQSPGPADLDEVLGRSSTHWKNLADHAAKEYAPLDMTWRP